ncbi:hypothetical protein [uncultured Amphritea sp.]|uniref:hypothetical protein n=1 Tax=uncultured Amphritea sp. TaxID=981605 RepID=UPI002630B5A9|nr:hypothetical protein [uncultured Amphritea sp.]
MKKLVIASAVLMSALTLSMSVQAGIYDYSRSAVGSGELIHESTEQGAGSDSPVAMTHQGSESALQVAGSRAPVAINAQNRTKTKDVLWQWDDVNYK